MQERNPWKFLLRVRLAVKYRFRCIRIPQLQHVISGFLQRITIWPIVRSIQLLMEKLFLR